MTTPKDPSPESVPVAILCGGRGTRLRGEGPALPKPLVEIGGRPILWHVIHLYARQGFRRFHLLGGYRVEDIAAFARATEWGDGVSVECVDTGVDTPTGGRLHRVAERLAGGTSCVTYADGLADLDLRRLVRFHQAHGAPATVTVVRPDLPFGVAQLDGDTVTGFVEKPRSQKWINGGFLCLEPSALAGIGPDDVLEHEPMERWATSGSLRGYRHEGFWDCMDTYKDAITLNDLWERGHAPWAEPAAVA
jgi:glucose-1-phosphate cytidylyltransferase